LVIITTLTLACQCPLPTIFNGPTPTPTPTPLAPLPPQVIQVTPARGEEQSLDAPVQFTFDQPMDPASVQAAFTVEPAVSGDFEWPTSRVMQFKPAGRGFERATRYTVVIKKNARSQTGLALETLVQFHFTTVGFLEVAGVQPAEDTAEIAADATVTVLFNRPVVPLTTAGGTVGDRSQQEGSLPQPLTFVPPVRGQGEWLNTSIYVFTPDKGFEPATTYKARVAAGLADTTGGVLADDFTWEFTTVMPAVVATHPDADTVYVSTEPVIHVAFNQLMDHKSAEAAFKLKNLVTGEAVAGTFEWHDEGLVPPRGHAYEPYGWSWSRGDGPALSDVEGPERVGVETMSFTPSHPLDFTAAYRAIVVQGAKGASGQAGTQKPYVWTFDTIAYPRIVKTDPADGEQLADPWGGLEVTFSSPMDPESINGNFTIRSFDGVYPERNRGTQDKPTITATQVFTYWWDSNTKLEISFPIEPNADYEVTINGDVRGRYGHELGEDTTIRWRTRARAPFVYLHAPDRVGTYNGYTQTVAYVTARNVRQVDFALYRMPLKDFLRANGENWWRYWDDYKGDEENLVRRWSLDVRPPLNQSVIYGTHLTGETEGTLEPGLYYLEVWADPEDVTPEAMPSTPGEVEKEMLVVSRHNLSLKMAATEPLVWATDLRSGDVSPDLPIVVMDEDGDVLAEGTTGQDGVFVSMSEEHEPMDPWTPVFAFVGDPDHPNQDFAAVISRWSDGITPWKFGLPVESTLDSFTAYFFTDRPIYRPGQTVYFKGILRGDDDAHYSLPTGDDKVHVLIEDPQGTKVFENDLSLSDMGTLNGEFNLDEEAALGSYYIGATYEGEDFYATFQVAEYRKPEFQVTIETDRPEYAQGDEINVTAQATYYFGGPVAGAQVRYSILSADHFFNYQGQGWWDFTDYDYGRYGNLSYGSYGELIAEGVGTTDEEGRFTFSLEADIAEYLSSQRFTLEVTVSDVNNQEVSNRTEAVVHKGLYYVGLRPKQYVSRVGQETCVDLITVDWASDPSPNRELTVVFAEHNWYSVRKQAEDGHYYWESTIEDVPIFTTTVETDDRGKEVVCFTPENGGIYKITTSGLDERENEIHSSTYTWVSGRRYINWRQENNDRIELIADQRQYRVGDTATVLVPHPYQGPVKALITVERGHVYRYWVQTLETNSEQIEIPITKDLIPNVFVSVIIVQGSAPPSGPPLAGGREGESLGPVSDRAPLPSFKIGYVQLPIETIEKELNITLAPDKSSDEHYRPGETVAYDVQVTDSEGEPVEAELTLSLVDLSVLSLADQTGRGIVDHFWRERGLGVRTASGLTLSADRVNLAVAPEAKGGGGGEGLEGFGTVRRRFPDTAYWNPTLRTDKDGCATASVELPDNLTTWRMGAWGVTADTLVGQANVDVVSTKDLLVRPMAPRFFVVGDEAELAAIVHNNTDESLEVEVVFEAKGLQVDEPASLQVSIPANDKVKVTWSVTVEDTSEVTLRFGAKTEGLLLDARGPGDSRNRVFPKNPVSLTDAIVITLPVYRYSTPEVVATAGQFEADGQRLEAVILPPSYDPTQGELSVHVDPSLAAGMRDGLEYLEHYPYECTEQTVSRFLPNVVTYRAFKELGLDRPDLEETLPELVSTGLQRLYNRQHYDGGWGWWVRDESDPFLSAYVLLGLVEAERAGFVVDEGVLERAGDFLKDSLLRPRDVEHHWQANRQAFILYVLAEADYGNIGRTVTLFNQRDVLDTFGKAYLAMALGLLEPDNSTRVDALLSDITSAAIVSATGAHWEEEQADYYAMNTDTRSTAIVLAALARLDPDNALAPNTVRWLMVARKAGYWETTQETAWAVLALTDWMVATGELEGAYDWHVVVNGDLLGEGRVAPENGNIDETTKLQIEVADLLADEANRVVIERWAPEGEEEGTGRLYYSLYLRYFKLVEEVTALNRGIIVSRKYTLADCASDEEPCQAVDRARVGDVIQVKLTIIAPNDLHYVVVEDPFPAGAEGVDQSLKTTSVVGEPPELTRTDRRDPWGGGWGWWWFSHTELRDEKAVLFATYLPRGTYEYTYLIRASLPGEYRVIPTHGYEMYFPEVFGRSDGGLFTIEDTD